METTVAKRLDKTSLINTMTFISITLFYFFESAQMAYFNVLAPSFLSEAGYDPSQVAAVSAAYYYGDVVGLFPVGYLLDRFPLRKSLIFALIGTIIGTFLLFTSYNVYLQWISRFMCGFFGGTFSFLGGIRVISAVYPKQFTYYMGIFLAAGMLGGMLSQYPLLVAVHHYGITGTMKIMFAFGFIVMAFNWFFLHPVKSVTDEVEQAQYSGTVWQMFREIVCNMKNLCDVLMIVLLDTPVSIIGTLWGIVLLMNFYHFSADISAWIVMALFAGLMLGLPIWGQIADKNSNPPWIIVLGAVMSFLISLMMFAQQKSSDPWIIGILFFGLGFFSSCQTLGFTWLTKNMRPELIGRNSAYNSIIFMGTNGVFKQLGAILLGLPALVIGVGSAANLLLIISAAMLVASVYAAIRKNLFSQRRDQSGSISQLF